MSNLRIVFMGTSAFAVPGLKKLIENKYNVVAVVTAPDMPQGRRHKQVFSPVKEYALQNNMLVLQPTKLKSPVFLEELKRLRVDIQVVVAFRMLPESVWALPPYGTFNVHASLLPHYRGAAPINWVLINGEKETGVTTFFIDHEIDTGKIIFQEKEPIADTDNAGTLHDRLMEKGAQMVLKTIQAISSGNPPTTPQNKNPSRKIAPKIFTHMCEIPWHKSAENVFNFIRGLSPYPTAWTVINSKKFKIFKASITDITHSETTQNGFITDQKNYLHIKTKDMWVAVEELQLEGKKKMSIKDFFRGNKI